MKRLPLPTLLLTLGLPFASIAHVGSRPPVMHQAWIAFTATTDGPIDPFPPPTLRLS